jgi:hypothetical protein
MEVQAPKGHKPAKGAKLRQIYLDDARGVMRAALVVEESENWCRMTCVLAYHKRDQETTAIDRAAKIAKERLKERN